MKGRKVLLVEDEPGICLTLGDRMSTAGYEVTVRNDGISGEKTARSEAFDILLLDLNLPGRDGLSLCRNLRKDGFAAPILMLTARDGDSDIVEGLREGADYYLPKPFDPSVLLARMEALLRRPRSLVWDGRDTVIRFGPFFLDRERGELLRDGEPVELNAREYGLLEYLVLRPGKVLPRRELLEKVWGRRNGDRTRTVDMHVAKLRSRLGEAEKPRHIVTVHGRGYRSEP
mgnify:FL=1